MLPVYSRLHDEGAIRGELDRLGTVMSGATIDAVAGRDCETH